MGSDGRMRDWVGEGIERLEERFDSFHVNQTTLSVAEPDYATACHHAEDGVMDVYVRVRNDDGEVLHVDEGDELSVPHRVRYPEDPLAAPVTASLAVETGVHCVVDGVARATIAGVHNEDDPDAAAVYRLFVLLDARHERGTPDDGVWRSDDVAIPEYV